MINLLATLYLIGLTFEFMKTSIQVQELAEFGIIDGSSKIQLFFVTLIISELWFIIEPIVYMKRNKEE